MVERLLRITGTQKIPGEEPEVVEITTLGRIYEKDGFIYIVYRDEGLSGFGEDITTTLKVCDGSVRLLRFGEDRKQMGRLDFITGEAFAGMYSTPFGSIDVTVVTKNIENSLSADGSGQLKIFYDMAIMGQVEAESSLCIQIEGGKENGQKRR